MEESNALYNLGSTGVLALVLIYTFKILLPTIMNNFNNMLVSQRNDFITFLQKHDDAVITEMRDLTRAVDNVRSMVLYDNAAGKPKNAAILENIYDQK